MEKKSKRGPLLYISQSFAVPPAKNMQEIFTSRQEIELPLEEPEVEVESKRKKIFEVSLSKTEMPKQHKPIEVKPEEKIKSNHDKPRNFNRVKSFKDMNIMERLEYLANFPKAVPTVPCVFSTEEKNYQGYLVEYNNQEVTIKFPDQTTESIPLNNIKEIIMIGIKR